MSAVASIDHPAKSLHAESIAILGQNRLVEQLVLGGIDIALPIRKHGVDLIAYMTPRDRSEDFISAPLRVTSSTGRAFSIDNSLESITDLLHVFVWNVGGEGCSIFALTHRELGAVAEALGYSLAPSYQKGLYPQPQIGSKSLANALEPFRMHVESWSQKLRNL